ncbi:MAG: hypothetical protein C0404_06495 [Verrucomicrobia bacterium]|nr:hypothetical protein [Verrucomicrobiota bacterium]
MIVSVLSSFPQFEFDELDLPQNYIHPKALNPWWEVPSRGKTLDRCFGSWRNHLDGRKKCYFM